VDSKAIMLLFKISKALTMLCIPILSNGAPIKDVFTPSEAHVSLDVAKLESPTPARVSNPSIKTEFLPDQDVFDNLPWPVDTGDDNLDMTVMLSSARPIKTTYLMALAMKTPPTMSPSTGSCDPDVLIPIACCYHKDTIRSNKRVPAFICFGGLVVLILEVLGACWISSRAESHDAAYTGFRQNAGPMREKQL
jgi:hypothetical protein